jgi:hypothetical protein
VTVDMDTNFKDAATIEEILSRYSVQGLGARTPRIGKAAHDED